MLYQRKTHVILVFLLSIPFLLPAQHIKIVTNHVGYESSKAKKAIIVAESPATINSFQLINANTGQTAYTGKPVFTGPVKKMEELGFLDHGFQHLYKSGYLPATT